MNVSSVTLGLAGASGLCPPAAGGASKRVMREMPLWVVGSSARRTHSRSAPKRGGKRSAKGQLTARADVLGLSDSPEKGASHVEFPASEEVLSGEGRVEGGRRPAGSVHGATRRIDGFRRRRGVGRRKERRTEGRRCSARGRRRRRGGFLGQRGLREGRSRLSAEIQES